MTTRTIQLSKSEERLRGVLLDAAAHINQSHTQQGQQGLGKASPDPVVLRWAGGWVRDKLLGMESHDIDVAINSMTGEAFGHTLAEVCSSPAMVEKHAIMAEDLGTLHTIKANPDKSKHLATATCRLFGADLDFVNLRKETYADNSRNPTIEFGTAEEDALRRDATVNSLFYNIHTCEVEDFTGGLADLEAKLIRTPLDPLQTFTDDPLRVLRLIRFASRLGFSIHPEAEKLMSDERVVDAFKIKITRERVGIELEKMLRGSRPSDSLCLIDRLGIYHAVFTDPADEKMPTPDLSSWHAAYGLLDHWGQSGQSAGRIYSRLVRDDDDLYLGWCLAALSPWETIDDLPATSKTTKTVPFIVRVAREGFKANNKVVSTITASHRYFKEILGLKQSVCSNDERVIGKRDLFGIAICKWNNHGVNWRVQVLYAILVEAIAELKTWPSSSNDLDSFTEGWAAFLDHLVELEVMDAPSIKPLVDGNMLGKALGVKPGRWMSGALEVCLAWQFRHPEATNPDAAIEEVRQRKTELAIPET